MPPPQAAVPSAQPTTENNARNSGHRKRCSKPKKSQQHPPPPKTRVRRISRHRNVTTSTQLANIKQKRGAYVGNAANRACRRTKSSHGRSSV